MLPEQQELHRLQAEQSTAAEAVVQAELTLETSRTELQQFQRRYYETVGRLYVELDSLNAEAAVAAAAQNPGDKSAQAAADAAREQARRSAEEAGIAEAIRPNVVITPELKATYRQACKHMHPDRATSEPERLRRTEFMARSNVAYEAGDHAALAAIMLEFGADPEAIVGDDIGAQMVKAIRRLAQLRRRLTEIATEVEAMQHGELYELKTSVEEAEALGGDPLGDLASGLMREISERKIAVEMEREG